MFRISLAGSSSSLLKSISYSSFNCKTTPVFDVLNLNILTSEPRGKRAKTETTTPKLGKAVLEDLRKEMSSAPEEVSFASSQKQDKTVRDRTEYGVFLCSTLVSCLSLTFILNYFFTCFVIVVSH